MSDVISKLILIAIVLFVVLNLAGLLIWVERRFLALMQDRLGPNRAGPLGLFIIVADIIKIFTKEDWLPPHADKPVFIAAPMIIMVTALLSFSIIPFAPGVVIFDFDIGVLLFLGLSSMGIYNVILAGWASNNNYALIGGLRMAAQMFSYEVFMGLSLMGVVTLAGSFNLSTIVEAQRDGWFIIPQFFAFLIFFIAALGETHRLPFDMPEAESELVAGYHTEYSSMKFGMFFVGEYIGLTLFSALMTTFFFGGWLGPVLPPVVWFCLKTAVFIGAFIVLRAALPRPRYDQLFSFGWKFILPAALLNLLATGGIVLWRAG